MYDLVRDVDTREFLIGKIKENARSYGNAVVKAVLFRDKDSVYIYEGRVSFLHKSENASSLSYDYGKVVLVQWVVDIEKVSDLIGSLPSESIALNGFPDVKIKGGLAQECYRVSNRYRSAVWNDWPCWFCRYDCDSSWGIHYLGHQSPITAPGLPPYPGLIEANRSFLHPDEENCPTQNTPVGIRFVIPDYRARIRSLEIEESQASVSIETREAAGEDLLLQFFCKRENKIQSLKDVTMENDGRATIKFPFVPAEGHAYLLDRRTGERIDSKSFGRWHTDMTDGITVKTSRERIEAMITGGEGGSVEFKMELGKDSSEFLETVVSFANTKGGTILIGVHDDGRVVGAGDDFERIEKKVRGLVANRCEPDIDISIEPFAIDSRDVVAVAVKEGGDKPYLLIGKSAYKRVIKDDYPLTRRDFDEMYRKKQNLRDGFGRTGPLTD